MILQRLKIQNFRSIGRCDILFPAQAVLIGANAVGKSTVCEAIDLLMGPDRLSRPSAVNEHDFPGRRYLGTDGHPVTIEIEGVLTHLTADLVTRYRAHLEYWNQHECILLDEDSYPEDLRRDEVVPALRLTLQAIYDPEEDEFKATTFFASPPTEDGQHPIRVSSTDKRRFGFIYLRALRTGTRALSLERGSLLDIVLRLKDEERAEMWEQTLRALETIDPPIHDIKQLSDVLREIDMRIRQFINLSEEEPSLGLFPSTLTRESLRHNVTLFGASAHSGVLVPYWRLGSGVVNAMVLSLLTFIAELKDNVIFAMEEPEIAIPPHTQRRIVRFLKDKMEQTILTTHSPFVLEEFSPESVVLLQRSGVNELNGHFLELAGLKAKTYRGGLRKCLAEAMLGRGVICVEGISDGEVLRSASHVLEINATGAERCTPLDLLGVTIVQCDGEGSLAKYGEFFACLGLKTYAFFDRQTNIDHADELQAIYDRTWELEQHGIERLLTDEVAIEVIRLFLDQASEWDDYPRGKRYEYDSDDEEEDVREICFHVLRIRKGYGYAAYLIEQCLPDQIPEVITSALKEISEDLSVVVDVIADPETEGDEDEANS